MERHHATADIIFEKIMNENPKMDPQVAVYYASFAKNSEVNRFGFSPLQIVMGRNPSFPGLSDASPVISNFDSSSKVFGALKRLDQVRVKYRELDCNEKLKKIQTQKLNPSVEANYTMGDPVLFRDDQRKEWKRGTSLIRYGKTLYLKYGNFLRRVPIDTVIPDIIGEEAKEEEFVDPIVMDAYENSE